MIYNGNYKSEWFNREFDLLVMKLVKKQKKTNKS